MRLARGTAVAPGLSSPFANDLMPSSFSAARRVPILSIALIGALLFALASFSASAQSAPPATTTATTTRVTPTTTTSATTTAPGKLATTAGQAMNLPSMPAMNVQPDGNGGQTWSVSLQVLALMTMLTLLPAALLTLTSFTRIVIVLGLLRQALGTGQTPSNPVIIGLSLFLSFFVMQPVLTQAWESGIAPYLDGTIDLATALPLAAKPLRAFMFAQIRESDLLMFARMAGDAPYASPDAVPFGVMAASFLTSELRTAFEIGFLVFLPFVVIDLVVSSVLMSMGMMMLSPMLISAPFKIMLFVLVDGWALIMGSLAASFATGS
jgi:flagellar biosynthesis protein FliP